MGSQGIPLTGVILPSLHSSQLSYLAIKQGNSIVANGDDFVIFYENLHPACLKPDFAIMQTVEIWKFRGNLIATNLSHAAQLLHVKNHIKKFFYVWDLEWLRGNKNFLENIKIYRNEELTLLCRSKEHAKRIEDYCNRHPIIIEDFNIGEIIKC